MPVWGDVCSKHEKGTNILHFITAFRSNGKMIHICKDFKENLQQCHYDQNIVIGFNSVTMTKTLSLDLKKSHFMVWTHNFLDIISYILHHTNQCSLNFTININLFRSFIRFCLRRWKRLRNGSGQQGNGFRSARFGSRLRKQPRTKPPDAYQTATHRINDRGTGLPAL